MYCIIFGGQKHQNEEKANCGGSCLIRPGAVCPGFCQNLMVFDYQMRQRKRSWLAGVTAIQKIPDQKQNFELIFRGKKVKG
jgi:hypothetical protein